MDEFLITYKMRTCLYIAFATAYGLLPFISLGRPIQNDYPEIGKPCPKFAIEGIQYFNKGRANVDDFKGKLLVLDFFASGCVSCFESFPKIHRLKKEFEGKVQFILIGKENRFIRSSYEKIRVRQKLDIPVAYDSVVFKRFGITYVPYIVVLDSQGIVRGVTTSLSKENIEAFLKGETPQLVPAVNKWQAEEKAKAFDWRKPLLINGNGGDQQDFLFRSVLTAWNGDIFGGNPNNINSSIYKIANQIQVVGQPLKNLYDLAYGDSTFRWPDSRGSCYGRYWYEPLLEVRDSTKFQWSISSKENLFNYSLIVPSSRVTATYLKEVMQSDLRNYFGYDVTVETRMMPCWNLVASERAKKELSNAGTTSSTAPRKQFAPNTGFQLLNEPIDALILTLYLYNQHGPPFFDRTGIGKNINLEVNAVLTDFADFKRSLKESGLDLIRGECEMKVILISDPDRKHP